MTRVSRMHPRNAISKFGRALKTSFLAAILRTALLFELGRSHLAAQYCGFKIAAAITTNF
ncbi:MAG: hypothetical protein AAFN40_02415 [Cyanobacteria bacterium J06560_6]